MTVAELRAIITALPDDMLVLAENHEFQCYETASARTRPVARKAGDPGYMGDPWYDADDGVTEVDVSTTITALCIG